MARKRKVTSNRSKANKALKRQLKALGWSKERIRNHLKAVNSSVRAGQILFGG
jgi:hypothetical protein